MDLFHLGEETTVKEWIEATTKNPDERHGIFRVRTNDMGEIDAYFFSDMIANLCRYCGTKPSYWWHRSTKQPLYNVTHWGKK